MKEVHYKIVHTIYPVNSVISRYADIDKHCTFCKTQDETIEHLFFCCNKVQAFWAEVSDYIFVNCQISHCFTLKDIICYLEDHTNKSFQYIVNFLILIGKFFIHRQKFLKSQLYFSLFVNDVKNLMNSLSHIQNKKALASKTVIKTFFKKTP